MMSYTKFLLTVFIGLGPLAGAGALGQQAQSNRPNIVVIMGDDIGMWNIGAYHRGMMASRTPNIDQLARQGVIFTDYYAELCGSELHGGPTDFPPMQRGASFNLDVVKEQVEKALANRAGQ